jgi:hypothetical protein
MISEEEKSQVLDEIDIVLHQLSIKDSIYALATALIMVMHDQGCSREEGVKFFGEVWEVADLTLTELRKERH